MVTELNLAEALDRINWDLPLQDVMSQIPAVVIAEGLSDDIVAYYLMIKLVHRGNWPRVNRANPGSIYREILEEFRLLLICEAFRRRPASETPRIAISQWPESMCDEARPLRARVVRETLHGI